MTAPMADTALPSWPRTLVVVAHPDDESFGLGAVIDALVRAGSAVHVLCLTHGEASTLGASIDLGVIRQRELEQAGAALGISRATLLDFPDGGLADLEPQVADAVRAEVSRVEPTGLLTFDPDGITGHLDHQTATAAAIQVAAEAGLPVLGWGLPQAVADQLNDEMGGPGGPFRGHPDDDLDIALRCDRESQYVAIRAHASQAVPGSPLWRRLELLGSTEWLRWLSEVR